MKRRIIGLLGVCLGLAIFTVTAAPASAGNTAKGKLTVDGKTVDITHVYAFSQPGFFDKKKRDIVVLMCDGPVTPEEAKEPFGIFDQVRAGKLHCVRHTINPDKQVINYEISHNRFKMTVSGGSSYQIFEPETFTGTTIAGRSRTTAEQKSFDDVPYSYDITFSADIAVHQSRKVGTKLPAGGGELWKAYLAHNKRILDMDIKEMREMAPEEVKEMSDEELKAMKDLAVAMLAKNPEFTEGYVNGDRGVLFITDGAGEQRKYGTVDMAKEKDEWVVEKEDWSDSPAE